MKEFISRKFSTLSKGLLCLVLLFVTTTISGILIEDYYFEHRTNFGELMYTAIHPMHKAVVLLTGIHLPLYGLIAIYNFDTSRKKQHLLYGLIAIALFIFFSFIFIRAMAGGMIG